MNRVILLAALTGAAPAAATELAFAKHVATVTLTGDLRLRHEEFTKDEPGQSERQRERFRLRVGAEFALDHGVTARLRFASGTGEQYSANQSYDSLGSQKGIAIDVASLHWAPHRAVSLSGGRMLNPLWRPYTSDIVFDEEFNPEGFAESVRLPAAGGTVFANALQAVVDEDASDNRDQWLLSQQAGVQLPLGAARLTAAASLHEWVQEKASTLGQVATLEGNRRSAGGVLLTDFRVAEAAAQLDLKAGPLPLSLQGTYIRNLEAELSPKEDSGFQAGLVVGKAKDAGSWEAAYFYKHSETDAAVADVADGDFGDGGTNRKGHIAWIAYNPAAFIQLKAKYFATQVIEESLSPGADDIGRLQVDASVRF